MIWGVKLLLLEMSDQPEGIQMITVFTCRISKSPEPVFTEFYLKGNQLDSLFVDESVVNTALMKTKMWKIN